MDKKQRYDVFLLVFGGMFAAGCAWVGLCPSAWVADLAERVGYQDSYIEWPAGEDTKNGVFTAYLMGYPFFMPDISVYVNGK